MRPTITLLTDFGVRDPYVGVMKGALLSACPEANLLDLTHEIGPQEVSVGAFWIARSFRYFPQESVHLCVVDPGVGTHRRGLCLRAFGHWFVGPDNGLFSDVIWQAEQAGESVDVWEIRREDFDSSAPEGSASEGRASEGTTFDGRDLFARAAGQISQRGALHDRPLEPSSLVLGAWKPEPSLARVRVVDIYGNLITDAPCPTSPEVKAYVHDLPLRWVRAYEDALPGEVVALRGSFGTVEIAARRLRAASLLGLGISDTLPLY